MAHETHYCIDCQIREVKKAGTRCKECQKSFDRENKVERTLDRDTQKNWHTQSWIRSLGDK